MVHTGNWHPSTHNSFAITLNKASPSFTGGDTNSNGILDPGETWAWSLSSGALTGNITFTAVGHGTDSLGNDYTYPPNASERDTLVVTFFWVRPISIWASMFRPGRLLKKGDLAMAKEKLSKAIEIFKECGADGWVKRYEEELARI